MQAIQQSEFPLGVAVCAWCKPKDLAAELYRQGDISHGICPRHLKKMQRELELERGEALPLPPRSRRRKETSNHPELLSLLSSI